MKKPERITDLDSLIDKYTTLIIDRNYSEDEALHELSTMTSNKLMQILCIKLQINYRGNK